MAGPNALAVVAIPFPKTYDTALASQVAISGPGLPPPGASSMGANGGVFAFSNGAPGALDTISNAAITAILPEGPLKSLLSQTYTDIPGGESAVDQVRIAFAALGGSAVGVEASSNIALVCVSGQKPSLTVTTSGSDGVISLRLTASSAA